jgi:hypothetical protein
LMLRAAQGILLNLLQASEALTGKQAGSSEHVILRLLSAAAKPLVPVCRDLARTVHAPSMPCRGSVSKWVQRVRGPCRLPASMQVLLCQLDKQSQQQHLIPSPPPAYTHPHTQLPVPPPLPTPP